MRSFSSGSMTEPRTGKSRIGWGIRTCGVGLEWMEGSVIAARPLLLLEEKKGAPLSLVDTSRTARITSTWNRNTPNMIKVQKLFISCYKFDFNFVFFSLSNKETH